MKTYTHAELVATMRNQIKWVSKLIAKYAGQLVDGSIADIRKLVSRSVVALFVEIRLFRLNRVKHLKMF